MPTTTFKQLFQRGFLDLIPIIPVDGELSPNSNVHPEMRGKVPGRLNGQGKWSGFDFLSHETTADELQGWQDSGAGIGLICRSFVAVDIDITDEWLSRAIADTAVRVLGVAPVRVGNAPKQLLLYRLVGEPINSNRLFFNHNGTQHLIEVLARTNQFVVSGIHPQTRKPYTWDRDLASCELTQVTPADLAHFLAEVEKLLAMFGCVDVRNSAVGGGHDRSTVDQDRLCAQTTDEQQLLIRAVEALPNDYPDREDYIKVGCAIKAAMADDEGAGLEIFQQWAEKWEGGDNAPETVERDWGRMHPPFEVGLNWLLEQARDNGFSDADADFDDVSGDVAADSVPFWDDYVYIESLERFVYMGADGNRELLKHSQFSVRFPEVGKGIQSKENAAIHWLSNRSMRTVVKVATYRPGQGRLIKEKGQNAVNLWSPGPMNSGAWDAVTADEIDVAPWLDLVKHLIPDKREREHLLDWIAFVIQNPGVKQNWHPLIGGKQGIGKDTIFYPLTMGLGDNAVMIGPDDINGQWTDWQARATLVLVEELNSFVRKEISDKMKPMLAAPPDSLRINTKGVAQYPVPNIINTVMFTNHEAAVSVSNDDRRIFVIWSESQAWGAEAFTSLYRWMIDQQGAAMVCSWLAERDISAHNAVGRAPHTQAKEDMARASLSPIEDVLLSEIELGNGVFACDLVTMQEVVEFLRGEGFRGVSAHMVGRLLRQNGGNKCGKARFDNGERAWVWAIRRAELYGHLTPKLAAESLVQQRKKLNSPGNDFI